jgi:hypothetical protein
MDTVAAAGRRRDAAAAAAGRRRDAAAAAAAATRPLNDTWAKIKNSETG